MTLTQNVGYIIFLVTTIKIFFYNIYIQFQ
jgi:hypothetical protein